MKRYGIEPSIIHQSKTTFRDPLKWSRKKSLPPGSRVFTCSWSDFFIDAADPWRAKAWNIIRQTPEYTYLLLTKRPERILQCLPIDWCTGWTNVALGITAETAKELRERLFMLCAVPSTNRFISFEPLLGAIGLPGLTAEYISWIIAGGESGPHARPVHQDWIRVLRDQCKTLHIPFFFKQWGRWLPTDQQPDNIPAAWLARNPIMRVGPAGSGTPPHPGRWFNAGNSAGDLLDGEIYHETPWPWEGRCK